MMTPLVTVESLQKSFNTVKAVQDISFNINKGEIFGLLGPNGSGKTTTIRCLCTLTKPDSGEITVGGISVLKYPNIVRDFLGYVAQDIALDKILTGRELLELQASLYHLPRYDAEDRIKKLLTLLNLDEYSDRRIGDYSGGIRKRFDIAAGLLHKPSLVVLDEPTVGLDIESRLIVWEFLKQLKIAGTSILITSHYLEEIDSLADNLAIIDRGKVIAQGSPTQLKSHLGGNRVTLKIKEFSELKDVYKAQEVLQRLSFVEEIIINSSQGNSLNLIVKEEIDLFGKIEKTLKESNLSIFSLSQSRPSLDDVYLAATGKTLMDAELAAIGNRDLKKEKKQQMN